MRFIVVAFLVGMIAIILAARIIRRHTLNHRSPGVPFSKEDLKAMRDAGTITQEEFDRLSIAYAKRVETTGSTYNGHGFEVRLKVDSPKRADEGGARADE